MEVRRVADQRVMPWKNGGGETREILVFPSAAGLDEFGWRVSAAVVASDGPFSIFAGVDRTLAVIEGNGMELSIDGAPPLFLSVSGLPLSFSCDVPAMAMLVSGPVLDVNVMTRRDRFRHAVGRLPEAPLMHTGAAGTVTVLLCTGGIMAIREGGQKVELRQLDCAVFREQAVAEIGFANNGSGYRIEISPIGSDGR